MHKFIMLILVYGPSGVGKTTAFKDAQEQIPQGVFASLDDVATAFGRREGIIGDAQNAGDLLRKLGADEFLCIGVQAADEMLALNPKRPVLLDVGAGFLESSRAGAWLSTCHSIVFNVLPETTYARQRSRYPDDPRTFEDYCAQEFSRRRCGFYAMARSRVDAQRRPEEVSRSLVEIIRELIDRETGTI